MHTKITKLDAHAFALHIYVAGQWVLEATYRDNEHAQRVANLYKTNNALQRLFTQKALHRRKYPIV